MQVTLATSRPPMGQPTYCRRLGTGRARSRALVPTRQAAQVGYAVRGPFFFQHAHASVASSNRPALSRIRWLGGLLRVGGHKGGRAHLRGPAHAA